MLPFDFRPRTRVLFGSGTLERLGEIAAELGCRRALLVTDPGLVRSGHPQRAQESLSRAGILSFLYDSVEENPTTAHVDAGALYARQREVDLLIGLGGGSAMDCAKGVNFLYTNGGQMADYWGVGKATKPMLPLIAIPTTAGTGSEAQSFALITDPQTHRKMACGDPKAAPAAAILDPALTASIPPQVAALTAVDAVSHAVETWATKPRNAISLVFSREAWRLLAGNLERALRDPNDEEARAAMLLGAHYAGAAIENSMLGAAHSCANPLTARFGVPHGAAVGVMLPAVVRFNGEARPELYEELGGVDALAERVEEFLETAALPRRLRDHGVDEAAVPALAAEAAQQWTAQFNPRELAPEDFQELYRCAL